jgi:hypothetical protein
MSDAPCGFQRLSRARGLFRFGASSSALRHRECMRHVAVSATGMAQARDFVKSGYDCGVCACCVVRCWDVSDAMSEIYHGGDPCCMRGTV